MLRRARGCKDERGGKTVAAAKSERRCGRAKVQPRGARAFDRGEDARAARLTFARPGLRAYFLEEAFSAFSSTASASAPADSRTGRPSAARTSLLMRANIAASSFRVCFEFSRP